MRGRALGPFASLGRRANDVGDAFGPGARPEREAGEGADDIDLAFAGLSQAHRMVDSEDRGDPMISLRAAKAEVLRQIGARGDGARAVPRWLRGVGIALTARGSAIRVNVHSVTPQDEREIAQIPRTVRPPGVGTQTPILVERVGDIAPQNDDAGGALGRTFNLGLGVGESALARTGGDRAANVPSRESVQGCGGSMRTATWQEASWDTGALNINPSTVGEFATQAGGKLGTMSHGAGGTGGQVLGAAGEGLRDAGMGAGIGASIGSVIPGIGTVIGGAIGAIGGAIVGVVHFLFGGPHQHARPLTPHQRDMLARGQYIYKTRHLPGAFQDAVLCVYNPGAYQLLRSRHRLPSEIEAHLLKTRAYAAHAAAIDRLYGARLRRDLAHLPPELRTLVGVSAVTGHARELYIALHHALDERARLARQAASHRRVLHLAIPRDLIERARLAPYAAPTAPSPEEPETWAPPEPIAMPAPEAALESPEDPFRDLPHAQGADGADAERAGADAAGVLDDLSIALEQSRRAQRSYLRDSWVHDTWLGDFLHLDQPDDPSAPVAPAPSPSSGRAPPITLVPEPDAGAPLTTAEEAHAQVLANRPKLPPPRWSFLQSPVQVYFWNPFLSRWMRIGDANGTDQAKGLLMLLVASSYFPLAYGLLHTAQGTEVIRAVKNPIREPIDDNDRFGAWRTVGAGVSRMWTPQFTIYARTFQPGEPLKFDFGWGVNPDTGEPFRDAGETDTGDIVDDVYGKGVALARLRPFLRARRLQAVAPGDPPPAPEARVFDWSRQWDTREAFYEAFGRRFGGRVLDLMLARGWRFVEVVSESQDAGGIGRTYNAQGDETPQAIAKRYDALARERWAAELKAANPQRDWTARIYAGDAIVIPDAWPQPFWGAARERGFLEASGPSTETGALGRSYAAEGGETPQAIAKRYDALARERWATELKAANPQRDWTARIYADDAIAIPEAWPQPFWGSARERGFLEASGPTPALAMDASDPFLELPAQRARRA